MAKGTVAKNNAIKTEKTNQVKEAEPKTNEKASDVLQAAKNAAQDVKTAVKESASEVKAAVTEKTAAVKEAVEEKAAAKTETVKDTAAETKETAKPAREKKPSRAAKKAAKAAKEELKPEVFIQYQGNEAIVADVIEKAKNEFVADGHRASSIKSLQVYLKPEEFAAYYVINQKFAGRVDLF